MFLQTLSSSKLKYSLFSKINFETYFFRVIKNLLKRCKFAYNQILLKCEKN